MGVLASQGFADLRNRFAADSLAPAVVAIVVQGRDMGRRLPLVSMRRKQGCLPLSGESFQAGAGVVDLVELGLQRLPLSDIVKEVGLGRNVRQPLTVELASVQQRLPVPA